MYSERTMIVDVIGNDVDGYSLDMKAGDLYVSAQSGDVLRRHATGTAAAPENKYVGLSGVKLSSGTYTFTFASGDEFTASSDDAYPSAESISDETGGGGSGGGVLVVTDTEGTLDKTWQEIADADIAVVIVASENKTSHLTVYNVSESNHAVSCIIMGRSGAVERVYQASSASGYPTLVV